MLVDRPDVLAEFRVTDRCPGCGQWTNLVPHHAVIRVGLGSRLDVPQNLLSCCWVCNGLAESSGKMNVKLQDALMARLWREARSARFSLQDVREYLWLILRPTTREVPPWPWSRKEAV